MDNRNQDADARSGIRSFKVSNPHIRAEMRDNNINKIDHSIRRKYLPSKRALKRFSLLILYQGRETPSVLRVERRGELAESDSDRNDN